MLKHATYRLGYFITISAVLVALSVASQHVSGLHLGWWPNLVLGFIIGGVAGLAADRLAGPAPR